jgi:tetratricopeptide (TPR) repeat protein
MYPQGIKCTDSHHPPRAALTLEGNALCMQCHEPEYDTKAHHFHDLKTEGAECISCHMPGKYYMGNDFRRDHSFRVPRPDLTVKFNTPNSCNGCHAEQTAKWAADWVKQWYGEERDPHYSETLALARERNAEDSEVVTALVRNSTEPEIVRATALEYLVESGAPEALEVLRDMLADPSALIRMTAVNQLYNLNRQDRLGLLIPQLSDPARTVRIAVASALSDIPEQEIPAQYLGYYRKANQEYRSSLLLNADFQSGQMLLGQYYTKTGNLQRAEQAYIRSLELDSLYVPSRVNLAQLYNRMQDNQKALNLLESVTKIQPDFAEAYYMKGLIFAEDGNLEEAALSLEKATKMSPFYTRAYYNLGLIYQNLGRIENAENAYLNGLATSKEDESLHNALAILYIQNNQLSKARVHVQFLQKLYPNNAQIQRMAELVQ